MYEFICIQEGRVILTQKVVNNLGKLLAITKFVYIINSGLSQSYTNQRDKNAAKVNGYFTNNRGFDERNSDSSTTQLNQVIPITCDNSYFM